MASVETTAHFADPRPDALGARYIATPDSTGLLPETLHEMAVLPVSAYVEAPISPAVRTIPDIYADQEHALSIARIIVETSRAAGDAINTIAGSSGNLPAVAPLAYDLTYQLAAIAADRALRLAAAAANEPIAGVIPETVTYKHNRLGSSDDWRVLHKTQMYQWIILRTIAGAEDRNLAPQPLLMRRLRIKLGKWRQDRMMIRRGGNGLHAGYLARQAKAVADLGYPITDIPTMVLDHAMKRDERDRLRISEAVTDCLAPLVEACGLSPDNARGLGSHMAAFYPESRLECRTRNEDMYAAYFDRWDVKGFLSAIGHTWHDPSAFFWTQCNRRSLPVVLLQHGGQYGYDDKQPGFFALDQTLPTHFASWGWEKYSSAFDGLHRRAKIVPLPDPRLSEMIDAWKPGPKTENLLLVPLSKFRSLEVRFNSIANDGLLLSLRRDTAKLIHLASTQFDKVIVTYRSATFDDDPLREMLQGFADRVEIYSSREMPASSLFERAAAVFWDVTATGPFESLTQGLPTAVLMRKGRWAADAKWAEDLFVDSGVGAYDPETACENLVRFANDHAAWEAARARLQPALDAYSLADSNWREHWKSFFAETFGGQPQ